MKPDNRKTMLRTMLPPTEVEAIVELAAKERRSLSAMIAILVSEALEARKKAK